MPIFCGWFHLIIFNEINWITKAKLPLQWLELLWELFICSLVVEKMSSRAIQLYYMINCFIWRLEDKAPVPFLNYFYSFLVFWNCWFLLFSFQFNVYFITFYIAVIDETSSFIVAEIGYQLYQITAWFPSIWVLHVFI